MKQKLWLLFNCVLIAAFALSACQPATPPPAPTAAPAAQPTTAPAAQPTTAPAAGAVVGWAAGAVVGCAAGAAVGAGGGLAGWQADKAKVAINAKLKSNHSFCFM